MTRDSADRVPAGQDNLLGLVLIVRDEATRIMPLLDSLRDVVDEVTVLDTGSTDGTQDVVRAAFAAGLRGQLHEAPFDDFASSRNRALDLHGERTVFTLMTNVDPVIGGRVLRQFLHDRRDQRSEGAYRVRLTPGRYFQTAVLRACRRWRYVGRTHEVAVGDDLGPVIPGVAVVVDRSQRSTQMWHERWLRDLALLQADLVDRPEDARPVFYLAQTYEYLHSVEPRALYWDRALEHYQQRAQRVGYWGETYEALFRFARMIDAGREGRSWSRLEIEAAYLAAHSCDPRRAEPLHALALRRLREGDHAVAFLYARRAADLILPATDMFVDEEVYAWGASDLVAASAYYLRDLDPGAIAVGRQHARRALRARPDDDRLRENLACYNE